MSGLGEPSLQKLLCAFVHGLRTQLDPVALNRDGLPLPPTEFAVSLLTRDTVFEDDTATAFFTVAVLRHLVWELEAFRERLKAFFAEQCPANSVAPWQHFESGVSLFGFRITLEHKDRGWQVGLLNKILEQTTIKNPWTEEAILRRLFPSPPPSPSP